MTPLPDRIMTIAPLYSAHSPHPLSVDNYTVIHNSAISDSHSLFHFMQIKLSQWIFIEWGAAYERYLEERIFRAPQKIQVIEDNTDYMSSRYY